MIQNDLILKKKLQYYKHFKEIVIYSFGGIICSYLLKMYPYCYWFLSMI